MYLAVNNILEYCTLLHSERYFYDLKSQVALKEGPL